MNFVDRSIGRRLLPCAAVFALILSAVAPGARATIITTGDLTPALGPGDTTTPGQVNIGISGPGTVDVNDLSVLTVNGAMFVQKGSLSVNSGGRTSVDGVSFVGTSGNGSLVVQGSQAGTASSYQTNSLILGSDNGTGTFEVRDGADFSATQANTGSYIGRNWTGAATSGVQHGVVTDTGSQATFEHRLTVGEGEQGQLNIINGGQVTVNDYMSVGVQAFEVAGNGTVYVGGAGSRLDVEDVLHIGSSGTGHLGVDNGARVDAFGVYLGGYTVTSSGVIAGNATAVVTGAGSTVTTGTASNTLTFAVGSGGTATLDILDGGVVSSGGTSIIGGTTQPGTGTVNISGDGAKLVSTHALTVGGSGTGTLNVGDNPLTGSVEAGGLIDGRRMTVGSNSGSTGTLNVSGPAAAVDLLGTDLLGRGAGLTVGLFGTGTVNISNGASMTIDSQGPASGLVGGLLVGGSSTTPTLTGQGTVNVDGAGSSLTVATGNMLIGNRVAGTMNITNGGVVDSSGQVVSVVGRLSTANGQVNIAGAGSIWDAGDNLVIGADADLGTGAVTGPGGTGTVNVANGGTLTAGSIYLGSGGALTGGGGTIFGSIVSDGTVAAGNSPGVMDIHGDVTLTSLGLTQIELGGTNIALAEYDQINVFDNASTGLAEGNLSVGGTIDVSFYGSFVAALGDVFDVFTALDIDVLAPVWNLPVLTAGLEWDILTVALAGGREALRLAVVSNAPAVTEPGTLLIVVIALSGLLVLRLRRSGSPNAAV